MSTQNREQCHVKGHLILQGKVVLVWLGVIAAAIGLFHLVDNPLLILVSIALIPITAAVILYLGITAAVFYAALLAPETDLRPVPSTSILTSPFPGASHSQPNQRNAPHKKEPGTAGIFILICLSFSAGVAALVGLILLINAYPVVGLILAIPLIVFGVIYTIAITPLFLYAALLYPTVNLFRCLLRQRRAAHQAHS